MKAKFLVTVLFVAFLFIKLSLSQVVGYDEAVMIATKSFSELHSKSTAQVTLSDNYYAKVLNDLPVLYIFKESSGGFIIIAGDRRVYPILAYCNQGDISIEENYWNPAFDYWVNNYINQILFMRDNGLSANDKAIEMWAKIDFELPLDLMPAKDVAPLLSTTWSQGCGYNAQCPVDPAGPCGHALTGCVATAMAQVLRYHEYPTSGIGNMCYTNSTYGELCADFESATYDYSSMTNNSGNSEVAELMYHCGVSVYMGYGPHASGSYSTNVDDAFEDIFDYTNLLLINKSSYTNENWNKILRNEIDNNRPFYYSGSGGSGGHAFVFDGYQGTEFFHINWGWGGSYNGYFYCNDLTPGSYNFNNNQRAILGMTPTASFTGLDVSGAVSLSCATPVSGDISTGVDYVNYYKNKYPTCIGKELVYTFTTTLPGRIRIKIENNVGGDVITFLLSHPHQDSVVKYGTNGLIIDDTDAGTYWIAVEGLNGVEPTFDIEVICPSIDADLIIEYPYVSHEFIESDLGNVIVKSTIRNIGNTPAAECAIEYFVSDDNSFDFLTDAYIDSGVVPALNPGEYIEIETIVTMPTGLTPGNKYIVFNVDRLDIVPESDNENLAYLSVQVPDVGLLDCSSAVALTDGVWYYGNTSTDGVNLVEQYWPGWDMTGPEVVHSFIAPYSGIATISFTNQVPGDLVAMVFPICNENTYFASLWMNNVFDTITSQERYVTANTEYFVVVDGQFGVEGQYGLLIELPSECPELNIEYSGSLELCFGDAFPSFWTNYGYSDYMWFKDGIIIPDENSAWFSPTEVGEYHVEVNSNGCLGQSDTVSIQMDFSPDTVQIVSVGATEFCYGSSVGLELLSPTTYDLNWALDGEEIPGATANSYSATESGTYSVFSKNGVCKVSSENSIDVTANSNPSDIGETLRIPSDSLKFYYTFDEDNNDLSDNNYSFICWTWQAANDRFGSLFHARDFTNQEVKGYVNNNDNIPDEFTLTMWFNTTSSEGGLLTGFFNNPWNATTQDAVLYMSDDGRIHFYLSNGGTPVELSSTDSYNDGNWHSVTIKHDFGMLMNINDGDEFLQISTEVTKQSFSGYWTFGGIDDMPPDLANPPSSNYINAKVDDILCIYEGNANIYKYNNIERFLDVNLATSAVVCDSDLVYFDVNPSEFSIEYKVWNNTASSWYPGFGTGTGESISIGGSVPITETTEFLIYAVNSDTGCETILDTSIIVSVLPYLTPNISISSDGVNPICVGTTINFTATHSNTGSNPSFNWYYNGIIQSEHGETFSCDGFTDTDTVRAVVYSNYDCLSADSAISNMIIHDVLPIITPSVSIVSSQTSVVCEETPITFTATATDCGSSPTYQWYRNDVPVGTDSDEYTAYDFVDNEEIYVVVTSSYSCSSSPTAESNHILTDVAVTPESSMSILSGGTCVGEEICFEYDGETTGLNSVEWVVTEGGPNVIFSGEGPHCYTPTGSYIRIAVYAYDVNLCFDSTTYENAMLTPMLTPAVSIVSSQTSVVCEETPITFTATATDCGSSPTYQWYRNDGPVGTDSDEYTAYDFIDNEEIYVVVTSSYSCSSSPTAESNHILTDVSTPPQAALTMLSGGNCINDEICFEYSGETAGLSSLEWTVNYGGTEDFYYGEGPHCVTPSGSYIKITVHTYDSNFCVDTAYFENVMLSPAVEFNLADTVYKCVNNIAETEIPIGYDSYNWSDGSNSNILSTSEEGLYFVTVTNEFGCNRIDSVYVINFPDMDFDLYNDTTICIGDIIYLEIDNGYSYNEIIWSTFYDGSTQIWHQEGVGIEYQGNSTQHVVVEAISENCTFFDTVNVHFDNCNLSEDFILDEIKLYPNPAQKTLKLTSDYEIERIEIYSMDGKVLYNSNVNSKTYVIEIENWAEGTYFIRLEQKDSVFMVLKFIKM